MPCHSVGRASQKALILALVTTKMGVSPTRAKAASFGDLFRIASQASATCCALSASGERGPMNSLRSHSSGKAHCACDAVMKWALVTPILAVGRPPSPAFHVSIEINLVQAL